jgi:RNA polymerase sigma-70 factor (ECF subfamily)
MRLLPGSLSDGALLKASRTGGDGFDAFYRRHRDAVLAFHGQRTRDPELAADLTAETFAAALLVVRDEARDLPNSPAAWLFTIAHRKFVDSYRRGRVEDEARRRLQFERLEIRDADVERINEILSTTDALAHLAEQLPAAQFAALRARVLDERDYADIADEMRCSPGVVRMRVNRALKALRTGAVSTHYNALEDNNG